MSFQVPPPLPVTIDTERQRVSETTRITLSQKINSRIEVGNKIDVIIALNQQGQSGIFIDRQFVPALLPKNLKDGQKVKVLVLDNNEALILKLLNQETENVSKNLSTLSTEGLLKLLIKESDIESLRRLLSLKGASASTSKLPIPTSGEKKGEVQEAHLKLTQLLDNTITQKLALHDEQFQNPESLQKTLTQLSQNNLTQYLGQAKKAVEDLTRVLSSSPLFRYLNALESKLSYILENPDILQKENTLELLLKNLLEINSLSLQDNTPEGKDMLEFLRNFTTALQNLRNSKNQEPEIKKLLQSTLEQLRDKFKLREQQLAEANNMEQGFQSLKLLEQLINGQEVLNSLTPLLSHFGEPLLFFLPALTDGQFRCWEFSIISPRTKEVDPDETGSPQTDQGYTKIKLSVSLPSLGEIQIDIAHRKDEILLNLTLARNEVSQFMNSQLENLRGILHNIGYSKINLKAVQGLPESSYPEWYTQLTHFERVV